ncbi:Uncharacterised protein [Salmonella enterica subsp. enterica serovar Typhi]|nr:Uncharacterised protein [Salmonella enterica subsp. enterica serovar Typhi]CHT91333.1 Uncharacterised protein [Salmonella enterica subsp. enterica serovar Typhi]CHY17095.1 Uncharacterised protein [Salmonella enterica subsp. enterica serovar Typhi]CHY29020.1 Uncharacterised protein [Salmonella enterica subsp. enterica serovar Typhi]
MRWNNTKSYKLTICGVFFSMSDSFRKRYFILDHMICSKNQQKRISIISILERTKRGKSDRWCSITAYWFENNIIC